MEYYEIKICKLTSHAERIISVEAEEDAEEITLKTTLDGIVVTATHYHYFVAFQNLRDQLLKLGWGMKCNGALENAVASPMMALVGKVYLVTPGEHARMKKVVEIFDYADIIDFPDTARQNQFLKHWKNSLTHQ